MADELKIVLEDVKEKFDTVIGAFEMVKERLDRHEQAEEERFQRIEDRFDRHEGAQEKRFQRIEDKFDRHEATQGERSHGIKDRLTKIEDRLTLFQKDFSEHRDNTELHAVKKKKKAS